MIKEIKDIPPQELERIQLTAERVAENDPDLTETSMGIYIDGYQNGAKAEYLRHLSGRSITAQPNHAALAIQWDASGRVWKVLDDAGISIEPGPMGDKTFSLIKENGDKEQVLPGDWIIKDQAGEFHCLKSIPSSESK